jgi:hypothetical protein
MPQWDHTMQGDLARRFLVQAPRGAADHAGAEVPQPAVAARVATWAHWSDNFRGLVAPVTSPDAVYGGAFGFQLESWW